MADAAHTPGPWIVEADDFSVTIVAGVFPGAVRATTDICDVWVPDHADDRLPNAYLIAAAPEMYSALKKLSFAAQTSGGTAGRDEGLVEAIGFAEAALIKASAKPAPSPEHDASTAPVQGETQST